MEGKAPLKDTKKPEDVRLVQGANFMKGREDLMLNSMRERKTFIKVFKRIHSALQRLSKRPLSPQKHLPQVNKKITIIKKEHQLNT